MKICRPCFFSLRVSFFNFLVCLSICRSFQPSSAKLGKWLSVATSWRCQFAFMVFFSPAGRFLFLWWCFCFRSRRGLVYFRLIIWRKNLSAQERCDRRRIPNVSLSLISFAPMTWRFPAFLKMNVPATFLSDEGSWDRSWVRCYRRRCVRLCLSLYLKILWDLQIPYSSD